MLHGGNGTALLGVCRELAPSKQESTTYEPSLVCKLLILGCRLLIPDRLLAKIFLFSFHFDTNFVQIGQIPFA